MSEDQLISKLSKNIKYKIDTFDFSYVNNSLLEIFIRLDNQYKSKYIRIISYKKDKQVNIAYLVSKNICNINTANVLKRIEHNTVWENHILENILRNELYGNKSQQPISTEKEFKGFNTGEITITYNCTGKCYHFSDLIELKDFRRNM